MVQVILMNRNTNILQVQEITVRYSVLKVSIIPIIQKLVPIPVKSRNRKLQRGSQAQLTKKANTKG